MKGKSIIGAAVAAAALLSASVFALQAAGQDRYPGLAGEMGAIRGANYILRSGWPHYDPKIVRADLAVAKALGFNSVRTFLSFADFKADPVRFKTKMTDFLTACRENGLTAMPAINPDRGSFKGLGDGWRRDPAVLYRDDFLPYRYLKMFMTELDRPFADVVVCWDLWNEPFWDAMIADDDMDVTRAGVLWFARTAERFKPVNPYTIGWALLEDLLEDPELCKLTPVVSFHFYNPTLTGYIKKYKIARDLFKIHGERPFLMTELGRPGMLQPYSDPAAFCESEKVGYYMWEVFALGGWQRIQGLVWEDGGLRASTLPKWIVDGYKKRSDIFTEGYDVTAAGADVLAGTLDRVLAAFADPAAGPAVFYDALEYFYNARRAADPGWTADLRDVYLPFDAKTPRETIRKAFLETMNALRPLIRTSGDRSNDNALGGEVKIRYEDTWSRTGRIENIWETSISKFIRLFVVLNPTFYQGGYGKGGGQAAGNISSERLLLQGWRYSADRPYLFEADVRPPQASAEVEKIGPGGTWGGLAVNVRPGIERDCGVVVGVTRSGPQGAGTVFVDRFPPANVKTAERLLTAALRKEEFDAAGFVHLGIRFQGDADFHGTVLVNGRESGTFAAKEILGRGDRRLALEGSVPGWRQTGLEARYSFDNLKVTDLNGSRVVLSDSFERSGKNGERISYVVDTRALEKMAALEKLLRGRGSRP
jgi:hypothetical protein